jgi:hypothetical protein
VRIPFAAGADAVLNSIAIDATSAYAGLTVAEDRGTVGEIAKVALTGGPLQILAPLPTRAVLVDDDGVYFTTVETELGRGDQALCSVQKAGGTPIKIGGFAPSELQLDGDDLVYFAAGDGTPGQQFLLRENKFGASMMRARTFADAPVDLTGGVFAQDPSRIYVASGGALYRVFK